VIRGGEESLAMFDLLIKTELPKNEQEQSSAVRVTIRDFLYNEATRLPIPFYSDEEVETKTDLICQ